MSNESTAKQKRATDNGEPYWPADFATVINSIVGYGAFASFCLLLPLFFPIALVLPGGRRYWIAVAMRWAMRTVYWVTPTVSWTYGGDVAALRSARVIVSNHEGMLDILAACGLPGYRTLLAKSWVFKAFPLGVAARTAGICNSDLLTPESYQEDAHITMPDEKIGLFVFPEGQRSRSGIMARFKPGAFVLATHLKTAVVPIVMVGSRQGIRPGSMWIHPTFMHSEVLPPMTIEEDESHRQFAQRVREEMVTARRRILAHMWHEGKLMRHILHRLHVHTKFERGEIIKELQDSGCHAVFDIPPQSGPWVFVGGGWSTMPALVRLLYPDAVIMMRANDAAQRKVAALWWQTACDTVVADCQALPALPPTAVIICPAGADQATMEWLQRQGQLAQLVAAAVATSPNVTPIGTGGWVYKSAE